MLKSNPLKSRFVVCGLTVLDKGVNVPDPEIRGPSITGRALDPKWRLYVRPGRCTFNVLLLLPHQIEDSPGGSPRFVWLNRRLKTQSESVSAQDEAQSESV